MQCLTESIICLSLWFRQIIDRVASDKSRYFTQPRPVLVFVVFSSIRVPSGMIIQPCNAMLGEKCVIAREILRKSVTYISPQTSHHGPQSF